MADAGPEKRARFRPRFWEIVDLATRTLESPRADPRQTGLACMERVVKAIERNQDGKLIGPIEAYVLNFSTKHPHPYKFFSPPVDNELMEDSQESQLHGTSPENSGESSRDPLRPRYQFDLLLSDAVYNGCSMPIWCEITEAAALLLNVHATEFWDRTEEDQFEHVRELLLRIPSCELYIRCTAQKAIVTDIIQIYVPVLIDDRSGHTDDSVKPSVWSFQSFHPDMARKRPWHDSKNHESARGSESGSELGSWETVSVDSEEDPHDDEEPELSGRWSRSPVRNGEPLNDERPIDKGQGKEMAAVNDLKAHHESASGSESGSELGSRETVSVDSEEGPHDDEEPELSGRWSRSPVHNGEPLNDERPIDKSKGKEIVAVNNLKAHHESASGSESGSELGSRETVSVDSEEKPHNDEEPELLGRGRRSPVRNEEPHHGVPVVDEEPDGGLVRNNPTPPFGAATVAPILEGRRRRHDPADEAPAKHCKFFKDAEV